MSSHTDYRVDIQCEANNTAHRTNEISTDDLIVRRGQPFTVILDLKKPFDTNPFFINLVTGNNATEEQGTMCNLSIPEGVNRSPKAKVLWKVERDRKSNPKIGKLVMNFTPLAVVPIGEWYISAVYNDEQIKLGRVTVLFNPWCPEDSVFLKDEKERQEYVMNEHGKLFVGSSDYIMPIDWDYGQFDGLALIACMHMFNLSHQYTENPADDVSSRGDPIYIGRVVSAMINSQDDYGVLEGNWSGSYEGGRNPTHWTGSNAIITKWLENGYHPVKYGQCWVFAAVMCSVMRVLGIPCRTITNFNSAHDNDANLSIDRFHSEEGVDDRYSGDSVWNFHVWVEGWMKRPDLSDNGKYDGWQVLDPTPQEMSDGIYCCGPASKVSILKGDTQTKYDVPFVYAEINADCIEWKVRADNSVEKIETDYKRVGQFISTKAVGSDDRVDVTDTYKDKEGTMKERLVFIKALIVNYENKKIKKERALASAESEAESNSVAENEEEEEVTEALNNLNENGTEGETNEEVVSPPPPVLIKFKEVSKPVNGKDVSLMLVLSSQSTADRLLSISISVQAMKYNGTSFAKIQAEKKNETLKPNKELSIPIIVPFSVYSKPMLDCDSMKISAMVEDIENPDHPYLKEDNVVLQDPPLAVNILGKARLNIDVEAEIVFENPVNEDLRDCTLTICGTGLWKKEYEVQIGTIQAGRRIRVKLQICPYKLGRRTLMADFDCSLFRDIKGSCTVTVTK